MPKRNQPSRSKSSGKRRRRQDENESNVEGSAGLPTIGQLYEQICQESDSIVKADALKRAYEQSFLERVVEPTLWQQKQQHADNDNGNANDDHDNTTNIENNDTKNDINNDTNNIDSEMNDDKKNTVVYKSPLSLQACLVWANIVAWEWDNGIITVNSSSSKQQHQQSSFARIVEQDLWLDVWKTLSSKLNWHNSDNNKNIDNVVNDENNNTYLTMLVKILAGMTALPLSLDQQKYLVWKSALNIDDHFWHHLPPRLREWRSRLLKEKLIDVNSNKHGIPFAVLLLQRITHLLQSDLFASNNNKNVYNNKIIDDVIDGEASGNSDDDDDESNDDTQQTDSAWDLLHVCLVLLRELLGTPLTIRSLLVDHLHAWHFPLIAQLALGNNNNNKIITNNTAVHNIVPDQLCLAQVLLRQVCERLEWPVDPVSGQWLAHSQYAQVYHGRARIVQAMAQRYYPQQLVDLIYSGVDMICSNGLQQQVITNSITVIDNYNISSTNPNSIVASSFLQQSLQGLTDVEFKDFMHKLRLLEDETVGVQEYNHDFLLSILHEYLYIPLSPGIALANMPLYPTEKLLWDFRQVPAQQQQEQTANRATSLLSLPQLSWRYISYTDYLLRMLSLVRLESAFDIRADLVDAVRRVQPVLRQDTTDRLKISSNATLRTKFAGWARMALEITTPLQLVHVHKPRLGQGLAQQQVVAEFGIDLALYGQTIRKEWDDLGEFDNLFLVTLDASKINDNLPPLTNSRYKVAEEDDPSFPQRFGVTLVRGCMILQVKDEKGEIVSTPDAPVAKGTKRTFRVALDSSQYAIDLSTRGGSDLYKSFNLVVRRHGRENNFKAVLETIRGLMSGSSSIERTLPVWLQPIILGQGDPMSAKYNSQKILNFANKTLGVTKPNDYLDFCDTFVNEQHLRDSFPSTEISSSGNGLSVESHSDSRMSYRLRFSKGDNIEKIEAAAYSLLNNVKGNPIAFTPLQVEAIRAGLSPGLNLVVGPPGTGKTDVAVQIIASLYHSFPTQRTVIVTHSNAALNDIFQKVMARGDIDERYLLRLGAGERELDIESTHDFTKIGRVQFTFAQRAKLLEEVQQLSESLGLSGKAERGADGSPSYTCETAGFFQQHHIRSRISQFERLVERNSLSDDDDATGIFPFKEHSKMTDNKVTVADARKYFLRLDKLFNELEEYLPLEILRTQRQRSDYLIMKQAKIVAMTCTHAAIARSQLLDLGFKYDNIVIEEAGQMTENDTFIPLLLQGTSTDDDSTTRLKRVSILGDHNQLPPIIKNMVLARHSHLDRSLFDRLIHLGVPYIELDKQGRTRPEIAALYSWRYNNLGNLDHVLRGERFLLANAGLAHTFQAVNVEDFEGKGETSPTAHFFQNVGEAEYVVALFQYLVLIGHSPSTISILTTYNGQKALIQDILNQRCGDGTPLAGIRPLAVATVDRYQGQQNDIILLSLVRTKSVGHLRDIRRLVVAFSRARYGLYVFCRLDLFAECHELRKAFEILSKQPDKLQLVVGETFPCERRVDDEIPSESQFEVDDVTHLGSIVHQMQLDLVNLES